MASQSHMFVRFAGTVGEPPDSDKLITANQLMMRVWWAQRNRLFAGMLAGVTWMGMIALVPITLGQAIDNGISKESSGTFLFWIGVAAFLYIAQALTWPIRHRLALGIYERTLYWMDDFIIRRGLDPRGGLDTSFSPGEVTSFITADNRRVSGAMDISCRGAGSIVTFIGVLTAMLVINWKLSLAVLCGLLPMLLVLFRLLNALERRSYQQNQRLSDASGVAADFISGLRVIKGVGGEKVAVTRYANHTDRIIKAALSTAVIRASTLALDLVMPGVIIIVVAWYGGHLVQTGAITTGQLVMFSGWSIFLVIPLQTFNEMGRKLAMGRAAAKRITTALSAAHAYDDSGQIVLSEPRGDLSIENVTVTRHDADVLENVSIEIESGEFVSIISSQAATSSLLSILKRATLPNQGEVFVDDVDIQDLTLNTLRATLLVAEHDATLFTGTLRQNLQVAKPDATDEELFEVLEAAAATDIVGALKLGLDGPVSERGRSLSGGQRQRVALGRALLARSPILVLVDPTSALDSFTEGEIVSRIRQARSGLTTIVFTSSKALHDISDRVIVIERGLVVDLDSEVDLP